MLEQLLEYLDQASHGITLFAVAVIVIGFARACGRYLFRWRDVTLDLNFKEFKVQLGNALRLGLAILVLADVIETITVTPTYKSLAALAFLVVIRTIVSWTLILETEGRWPWQAPAEDPAHA
jgi:uncharacterized membrane protein